MGILKTLKIVKSDTNSAKIFENLFPGQIFTDFKGMKPHDYVAMYYGAYKNKGITNPSLNGKFFEIVITTLLINEGILPIYLQAEIQFVPNVDYDIVLYNLPTSIPGSSGQKLGFPICLSCKTTLRERWKQADLEAVALKYVHRNSKSYILCIDKHEAEIAKAKIREGGSLGLAGCIDCYDPELDDFIAELKSSYTFGEAGQVDIIINHGLVKADCLCKLANLSPKGKSSNLMAALG